MSSILQLTFASDQNLGGQWQNNRGIKTETTRRWKIMLQCETGAGEVATAEVRTMERNARPKFSQRGLLHREGKAIWLRLQRTMLRNQATEFFKHSRPCPDCDV